MSAKVAVVRCDTYEESAVFGAVGRGLELLGGAGRFVHDAENILLKPNLLVGATPDKVVNTHPAVFSAVARHLAETGAKLSWGDSPGFGNALAAARKVGIAQVAEALGVTYVDFTEGRQVSFPEGELIKQFVLASAVLDADGLVTLPKLKTHALTRMTGAVKNQFGCVPGMLKGEFHMRMPDVERFAQMLVDLNRLIRPRLAVMDGIIGMEGNGPRGGDPRQVGVILLSDDLVALDAAACKIMNLDPVLVGTITYGERWGLGTASDVEFVGDDIEALVVRDYNVNRSRQATTDSGKRRGTLAKRLIVPRPVIDPMKCTACGTCVSVCPVTPKAVDWKNGKGVPPVHDYASCIRCYCCQELCPERAIEVEVPPLGRLLHRRS
ncbi:MAG: DUF362 domain-containing protein [Actinobacteria bacterium]|nr:MAG: DUF362 domain-containing protein [Actinomycetota bacterium]